MSYLIKPINYKPLLDRQETEQAIKLIKDFFSKIWPQGCACIV